MTDWINHPIKSSHWPTNHYLVSDWQTKWLADRLTELFWLSNWLTVSLWETNWLTDRLTGWMTDWCTDWSINSGIDLTSVWEGEVGMVEPAKSCKMRHYDMAKDMVTECQKSHFRGTLLLPASTPANWLTNRLAVWLILPVKCKSN